MLGNSGVPSSNRQTIKSPQQIIMKASSICYIAKELKKTRRFLLASDPTHFAYFNSHRISPQHDPVCPSALKTSTVVPRTMKTPSGTNIYPFPKSSHAAPAPGAQADEVSAQCQGELAKGFEFAQGCGNRGGTLLASERAGASCRIFQAIGG